MKDKVKTQTLIEQAGIGAAGRKASAFAHALGARYHAYTQHLDSETYQDPATHQSRTYQDGDLTGPYYPKSGYHGPQSVSPWQTLTGAGTVVYVNGMNNNLAAHVEAAQATADKEKHPVVGVFNATGITKATKLASAVLGKTWSGRLGTGLGLAADAAQCLSDDEGDFLNNPAITTLVEVLKRGSNRNIVAHSQGTLIVTAALRRLKDKDSKKRRDFSGYNIKFFGSPASTRIVGPNYVDDTSNNDDAVASFAMDGLSLLRNTRRLPKLLLAQVGIHTSAFGDNELSRYNNRILTPDRGKFIGPHNYENYENASPTFDELSNGRAHLPSHTPKLEKTTWPATLRALTGYNAWGPAAARKATSVSRSVLSGTLNARRWIGSRAHALKDWAGSKAHAAFSWSRDTARAAGNRLDGEAHDSGQWMLRNREWIGDTLHEASTVFGVLAAVLGVTALAIPPTAPFLVPAALTFGAAAAAARAWHSTSLAVGTIDGSVRPEAALNEAKWAAVDTALSVATVSVSNARFIARATTVPGMKAVAPMLNNPANTAVTLNHILQQTNKLFGLKLGLILRNPMLAARLGWVSKALATAKFVKKLVEMGTSRLLRIAHGVAHGIAGGAKSAWNFAKDTGTGLRHWGEQRAHQAGEFFHNLKEKYYPSPKHDNASGSAAQDIGQCATDKFGILGMGMRNAATNTLAGVIGRHGSPTAKNGELDLHAHSQSGMSVSEAFHPRDGMSVSEAFHPQGGMSVSEAFHPQGGMSVSEAFHPRGGMSVSEAFHPRGGMSVSEAFRQLKGKRKDVRALPFLTGRKPNTVWSALDRGVRGGSSGLERGLRGSGTTLDTGLRGRGQDLDTGWRNSAAVYGSTARLGGGMLDHRLSRSGSRAVKAGRSGANAVDDSFDAAKALQRSGYGDHPDVNPAALRADLRKQSSGFLPDGNIRARLGGHLGFDPGGARLHTGPAAAAASRRLNAEAFTIGNDVFFGEGRFDPHTPKGLGLIAHELTHVGQQTGTTGSKARFFSEAGGDQMEREAQQTAEHVLANAGSRSGLFVEDYVREYEGDGGLTQADQLRLDRISVMALAEAQRMLASQGMHGSVNADALDVEVEIDLGEMSDGEAARAWAGVIVAGVSQSARPGGTFTEPSRPHLARKELDWDWSSTVAPQDWKYSDRIIWNDTPGGVAGRPDNTFIKAAVYNTKALDPSQYATIGQRSNYYEVMSNIIQQNPACKDVKFFDAAAQVTNARSVGAVEHFWGSGFGSGPLALRGPQAKSIYTDVNAELFTANMGVINSLLYRTKVPTSPLVPGSTTPISATAFDLEMVEKEQGIVETHLAKYKATFSPKTIAEINRDLNYKGVYRTIGEITFWPLGDAKASYWAKAALGVGDLDFFNQTHRIAIGKAKVFGLHGLTEKDYAAHIHSATTPSSAGAASLSTAGTPVVPPQRRALSGAPADPGRSERAAQAVEAQATASAFADMPSRSLMATQFGFQPLRSQAYGTLEREAEHVSAAVRSNEPHAAPALSAAPLGIQNYDTYEHVKFGGEPGNQRMVTINGVVVSYGELISMGDFFENPDQIYDTPPAQLKALVEMIRRQVADPKSVTDSDWAKVSPRYLDLATKNDAHFAPSNPSLVAPGGSPGPDHRQTWERLHKQALDLAQDGQPDRALATNAFGDHFLTDAFATGHLINKGDVMARFRSRFADSNTRASFFKAVARNVWADSSVAAYVSQYETGEPYMLGWHPNIDSASRFSEFLSEVYKAQPDVIDNAVVKIIHDRLNDTVGGLEVHNAAGQLWHLSGDDTLNSESLDMGRRAVDQSQKNILGINSSRVPSPGSKNGKGYTGDLQPLYKKVWNYCPIPTDASVKAIHDVIETMTNPSAQETIVAAGAMIREKIHTIIEEAVRLKKLRKA